MFNKLPSFTNQSFFVSNISFYFVFTVSSGNVTVNNDSSVQILAELAVPVSQLDPQVRFGLTAYDLKLAPWPMHTLFWRLFENCSDIILGGII